MALERTPLHAHHAAAGATLVAFAGWELPQQYTSIPKEHLAVRSAAGLFDVSHMGELLVTGPGAAAFLAYTTTRDMHRLAVGRCRYCHILDEQGRILDDTIVSRLADEEFMLVPNASATATIHDWLASHADRFEVRIADRSAETACLALQGPRAMQLLRKYLGVTVAPFSLLRIDGGPLICGTGYTGEKGCELFVPADRAAAVWEALLALGATPCGLGARDTLRLDKGYLLSGQDFDGRQTPLETGHGWVVDWNHDFLGRAALAAQRGTAFARLQGLRLTERGVPRTGCTVRVAGVEVTTLTSGTHSPSLKQGVGLAYLTCETDTPVEVVVRGKPLRGCVTPLPFL